ncbi:hypothetical protein [Burkholderia plantarii]|uniref:hypothetical protein n=1 Tax=Burkholderia plantarii TaxID=41899 RepID=UPI00070654E8|nr:hypothetical protein bpln_1g17360 [Burkholderia plantarii]WLE59228.1 hypothetical protein GIY62_00515 [Burkholderia plantarii]GLZ19780.1 hypothetical protein Bpla01_33100 [Burkholderia plantarii]
MMPHRFVVLEKIAFSLVVMSAVACTAFITYERCPDDLRDALDAGKDMLAMSAAGYSIACASADPNACIGLPTY